ncbi:hypothetical protein [Dysgonomonas sp. BGC7]|uniref:hypothetical protein n=1 Tax=Dysgonomonas sp. BGC7 TaxID=1658008 RepID=UPI000683592F|nr:hypothetical protein [Dysgonomonas sp. BGC7]MBD8388028.1 hypothetical protein [Dysgonomonas sp. BGC7]
MKKVLIGAAVGLAAGYVLYRLYQDGKLDGICDSANKFATKAKRDLKNAVDVSKNQVEYLKERAEYGVNKAKEKLDEISETQVK